MLGQLVSHYHITEQLGSGGMGVVYAAEDIKLLRRVALKFFPEAWVRSPQALERFEREGRAAAGLNHPNICTIFETGEHEGQPFIAMELLEGGTLKDRLAGKQLKLAEVVERGVQIAAGLDAAHLSGIIHRDIKPGNIFVTRGGIVKIVDFGLARPTRHRVAEGTTATGGGAGAAETELVTSPGSAVGTVAYMSPEQALGEDLDTRTDLFSFGAVLYEMATGRSPFPGNTPAKVFDGILRENPPPPSHVNPEMPLELDRIILKALEKDREMRYQYAAEIRTDLKRLRRESQAGAPAGQKSDSAPVGTAARAPVQASWKRAGWVAAAVAVVAGVIAFIYRPPVPPPSVNGTVQLTSDGTMKFNPVMAVPQRIVTDGSRLYFRALLPAGGFTLQQVSVEGGPAVPVPSAEPLYIVLDMSPVRPQLLVSGPPASDSGASLWVLPLPGGESRRLGSVQVSDAAISPGGEEILYFSGGSFYRAKSDLTSARRILDLKGLKGWPAWGRWSPDGKLIRFTQLDEVTSQGEIWEMTSEGSGLHPLLRGWKGRSSECCGSWTPDGRYYVFQSTVNRSPSLWAIREKVAWWQRASREPVRLTYGQLNAEGPTPSLDGKKIYFTGTMPRSEVLRYDRPLGQFVPFLAGLSAEGITFSADGKRLAYVSLPEGTLWRAKADGGARTQLTFPPMAMLLPRWSPDGRRIAFNAQVPGKPFKIYVMAAEGGTPEQLIPGNGSELDVGWAPDGNSLVFDRERPQDGGGPEDSIKILDLRTRQVRTLPGSARLYSPRWSPDGRFIVATTADLTTLRLFDVAGGHWSDLATKCVSYPNWSRDSNYIYFMDCETADRDALGNRPVEGQRPPDLSFYRVRVSDRKLERVANMGGFGRLTFGRFGGWTGLGPEDSPLAGRDISVQEIYALEWDTP